MQYSKYLIVLCFLSFSTIPLFAQSPSMEDRDITGLWRGYMYNDTTKLNYRYEIAISDASAVRGHEYTCAANEYGGRDEAHDRGP